MEIHQQSLMSLKSQQGRCKNKFDEDAKLNASWRIIKTVADRNNNLKSLH